jgi:hypothetical protein
MLPPCKTPRKTRRYGMDDGPGRTLKTQPLSTRSYPLEPSFSGSSPVPDELSVANGSAFAAHRARAQRDAVEVTCRASRVRCRGVGGRDYRNANSRTGRTWFWTRVRNVSTMGSQTVSIRTPTARFVDAIGLLPHPIPAYISRRSRSPFPAAESRSGRSCARPVRRICPHSPFLQRVPPRS